MTGVAVFGVLGVASVGVGLLAFARADRRWWVAGAGLVLAVVLWTVVAVGGAYLEP